MKLLQFTGRQMVSETNHTGIKHNHYRRKTVGYGANLFCDLERIYRNRFVKRIYQRTLKDVRIISRPQKRWKDQFRFETSQ
jgi:hypothetical protein